MATKRKTKAIEHDDSAAVTDWFAAFEHPLKPVLEAVRQTILSADAKITEGVKWNAPSFYCHGWFATANVRSKHGLLIVLHHGAQARTDSTLRQSLDDPAQLLTWLAADRATVSFASVNDFADKQEAFTHIIQQWAEYQTHNR